MKSEWITTGSCEWYDFNVASALSASPSASVKDVIIYGGEEDNKMWWK